MMKKILILGVVCASISAQALDINAFRASSQGVSLLPTQQTAVTRETQTANVQLIDIPIDKNQYLVGPGDQFQVNIISSSEVSTFQLVVSPSGEILIPSVGVIPVYNMSLHNAIDSISHVIKSWNQTANIHVTLAQIRKFKIRVVGHLKNPGYITTTPVSRVSDIFNTISEDPSNSDLTKRNIKLLRGNDTLFVDLVKFGVTGNIRYNPFIQQGDIIVFSLKESFVGIYGGVKIPGDYEFVPDESLEDLILLSGGFKINAYKNKIEFTRFVNATEKQTSYIDYEKSNKIIVKPEDHFMVRFENDYKRKKVINITGEVHFPGTYSIDDNTTLSDIIDRSGGFTNWADPSHIQINNEVINSISDREKERILLIPDENRSMPERAYIKARALTQKGTIESNTITQSEILLKFKLVNNDQIIVPQSYDFIELVGGILKPGRYPFYSDKTVKDYLLLAGGKSNTAKRNIFIIKAGTGQRIPVKMKVTIENGDTIFIPEKIEYNNWNILKDFFAAMGQVAALIVVIQNAIGK